MKTDYYLTFVVFLQTIAVVIQLMLPLLGIASVESAASLRVLYSFVTFLPGIFLVFRRNAQLLIVVFLYYFFFLILNYIFYPYSHEFINGKVAWALTPIYLLSFIFILCVRDFLIIKRVLLYFSRFSCVVAIIYLVAFTTSPFKGEETTYSMSFSYAMLLPIMYLFSSDKYLDKMLSVVQLIIIVLIGSRGALVTAVVFCAYSILIGNPMKKNKTTIVYIMILLIFGIYVLSHIELSDTSRTMSLFESGELISHDSERSSIYDQVIYYILDRPLLGWGVGADMSVMGMYAHNVFLELYLSYGLIIGNIIIVSFFRWCLRMYRMSSIRRSPEERIFFVMMFLYAFIPSLVSNSYLDNNYFIMIGCIIMQKKHLKLINRYC